jgi:hypothetical protein
MKERAYNGAAADLGASHGCLSTQLTTGSYLTLL